EFGGRFFPHVLVNGRAQKMFLFKEYMQKQPVGGLLLGSSRSMKLDPKEWQAALGVPFFNFGVEYARAEDYLAIYHWVRRQGVTPRYVVIGLDVDALDNNDLPDERLQTNEELKHSLDEVLGLSPGWWKEMTGTVSSYHRMFTANYCWDA